MNCTQIRDQLLAWQYGELPDPERALVEKHLEACADCREQSLAWQEFRRKLDAFRPPTVAVDPAMVCQQAVQRQDQRVRWWRRTTVAVTAAAAVVLIVVGLKLELRVDATHIILGWGDSARVPPVNIEPPAPAVAQTQPPIPPAYGEDLQLVKDLVRVLAREIQVRRSEQQEELLRLQTRFETLLAQAYDHLAGNDRDVAALYAAHFRFPKKGENP